MGCDGNSKVTNIAPQPTVYDGHNNPMEAMNDAMDRRGSIDGRACDYGSERDSFERSRGHEREGSDESMMGHRTSVRTCYAR